MITRDLECPWHDYCIICSYDVTGSDCENSLYAFGQSEKEIASSMYNNEYNLEGYASLDLTVIYLSVTTRVVIGQFSELYSTVQAADQAWYACPHQTCLIRGCLNEQNIAHQTREQNNEKCFKFLIECLMAFKFYQTRSNHSLAPNKVSKR